MLSEGSSVWSPQKKIIKEQEYIRVISGPSKERDMYLMAASGNHSLMALTIVIIFLIALLTSNILMIPALHKGFITVIRMYWPADKNILDLWKIYFTWMNTSAICFIGYSFTSLIKLSLSLRLIHCGGPEKISFLFDLDLNIDSLHSASSFGSLHFCSQTANYLGFSLLLNVIVSRLKLCLTLMFIMGNKKFGGKWIIHAFIKKKNYWTSTISLTLY